MIRKAFEAESGEMDEAGLWESLARESVVDASRLIALSGSFEGIGLPSSGRLIPEVTPAKHDPAVEPRPPDRILIGISVKVANHEGTAGALLAHPGLKLREWLLLHASSRHVNGRDSHVLDAAAHPVVLELVTLEAEALIGVQFQFAVDPHVTLPAMKGSPRAVLVAGRCQARLIMPLAALKEFGQDDDVGPPTNS